MFWIVLLVILFFYVLYKVVKVAVRNGINESMLFTDEQRKAKMPEEIWMDRDGNIHRE